MDGRFAARTGAAVLIAAALLGARSLRAAAVHPAETAFLDRVPLQLAGWVGEDIDVRPEVLELLRPDGFLLREYRREGEPPMQLYVDYHRMQRLGSTIHSPRVCYPGAGWERVAIETTDRIGGAGGPGCWLRLRSGDREIVSLYWYESRWGRSGREMGLKSGIVSVRSTQQPLPFTLTLCPAARLSLGVPRVRQRGSGQIVTACWCVPLSMVCRTCILRQTDIR
jgi:EpsI family protein